MLCVCVQPRVADLYSLDKDELQDMLDPLKQRVNTMENEARNTLDKVSTTPFPDERRVGVYCVCSNAGVAWCCVLCLV